MINTVALLRGLRFVDNFFPSGGYAFSFGLETAIQKNGIRTSDDLMGYVADLIKWGMGGREAVAVGMAHRAAETNELQTARNVDGVLESMKACSETRLASRQMGRQVLLIAGTDSNSPIIVRRFLTEVQSDRSPGHMAVSLGVVLGALGWKKQDAIAAYLYQSAVGFVSAALKLFSIGQRKGQRVLENLIPLIDQVSQEAQRHTEMISWSPIQDIHAMQHERLTVRLFRS